MAPGGVSHQDVFSVHMLHSQLSTQVEDVDEQTRSIRFLKKKNKKIKLSI